MLTASKPMTKEEVCQKLGIDPSKWNWAQIIAILQAILAAFTTAKAQAKAAGCPEHDCACHEAAYLSLQAACLSLSCCEQDHC